MKKLALSPIPVQDWIPYRDFTVHVVIPSFCLPAQICLCDFEGGDMLRQLPCKHEFHQPCIEGWAAHHQTCPLCRYLLWESPPPHAAPSAGSPLPRVATTAGTVRPAATASTAPHTLPLAPAAVVAPRGGDGDGAPSLAPPPAPTTAAAAMLL